MAPIAGIYLPEYQESVPHARFHPSLQKLQAIKCQGTVVTPLLTEKNKLEDSKEREGPGV